MRKRQGKLRKSGEKATTRGRRDEVVQTLNRVYPGQGRRVREEALRTLQPVVETRRVKRAGRGYPVPQLVKTARGTSRAVTWLLEAVRSQMKKHQRRRADARVRERRVLYEERRATRPTGGEKPVGSDNKAPRAMSLTKRNQLHKEAIANRVYTQMRWY